MERPELGLPSSWELTPLTHSLITPEIASLFHIIPEPPDHLDLSSQLNQLWCSTICFPPPRKDQSILKLFPAPPPPPKDNKTDPSKLFAAPPIEEKNNLLELDPLKLFPAPPNYNENNQRQQEPYPSLKLFPAGKIEAQSSNSLKLFPDKIEPCDNSSSPKRKIDLISSGGEEPSTILDNNNNNNNNTGDIGHDDEQNGTSIGLVGNNDNNNNNNRAVKRPRLVWTPHLHKRFVDVIEQLGIDKAVPKTIMEMMNVDGLTRENVASHLQKYRLYLKRMKTTTLAHARCTEKAAFPKLIGRDHDGGGTIIIPSMGDDDQCPPLPLPLPPVNKNNNAGSPPTNAGDIINLGGGGGNIFGGRQVMLPHQQQLHSAGYSNSVPPPLILPLPRVMGTGTAGSVIGSTGYRSSYGHFGMPTSAAAAGGTSLWDS